jgi:hypothetical protein
MIELALGAAAAALFAKALDRAGEKAVDQGEGALRRLVELVRGRLSSEEKDSKALEKVEDAPDSPSRVEALAQLLDERTKDDRDFRRELKALVEEAEVNVGDIAQATYGPQSPVFGVVSGKVDLTFGGESGKDRPRRLSD